MSWASRRQFRVISVLTVIVLVLIAIPVYKKLNSPPTCTDRKQNGDERGVDCGGVCKNFCPNEVVGLSVKWARAFPVSHGVYNVLAYVENQNKSAAAQEVSYEFKVYNSERRLIARREGKTFISPNGVQPIIETGIQVGNEIPQFTNLTFTKAPVWVELDPLVRALSVTVSSPVLTTTNRVRLDATTKNQSPKYPIFDATYTAILYNQEDNAIAVSKTSFARLDPSDERTLIFTWPEPFSETVARAEIVARFNPFTQDVR